LEQARHIPKNYLNKYCLKGIGSKEGTFLVDRSLRSRVNFMQVNLNSTLPKLGEFDLVFLRNVMIYFDEETNRPFGKPEWHRGRNEAADAIGVPQALNRSGIIRCSASATQASRTVLPRGTRGND
jgi:hypothetical protein